MRTRRRLLTWGLVAAAVLPSVALAATIRGSAGADRLIGTPRADTILGRGGNDFLDGAGGSDSLWGGAGNDRVQAAEDGARDTVHCGPGADLVDAGPTDVVAGDCEVVSRQISTDAFSDPDSQHRTQVEPGSFASGRTIVTAFQSARFADGGASGIGFSTSTDGARTWHAGVLPALTVASPSPGPYLRASDPAVAYDALHGVWLVSSLEIGSDRWAIAVSRSADGLSWSAPVTAVGGPPDSLDKEWVSCDKWPTSPHRGSCYLSYLDARVNAIATSTSTDGGATWGPPTRGAPAPNDVNGAQPIALPDGTLVVVYGSFPDKPFQEDEVLEIRSSDGGESFSAPSRVAVLQASPVRGLRAPPLPAVGIDDSGRLYAVWEDCRFSASCARNDLVLATSADGLAWTDPIRIPTTPPGSATQSLVPGLGVDPATGGGAARLSLVYYTLRTDGTLDVYSISSADGGATWSRPQRLNADSMTLSWIANTNQGAMVGDYVALSYVADRPIPIFSLAARPTAPRAFRQSIYARTR